MARRIPKDAMTRALSAAGEDEDQPPAGDPKDDTSEETTDPDSGSDTPPLPDKLYFRIGEVAGLVGVDAHVLRYWESEFRMKPHRSSSGQRLYRKQDLSRFFRVKRLLHDEGYTIAGARKVLAGGSATAPGVDIAGIRGALERLQQLRDQVLELRDELDPEGRA